MDIDRLKEKFVRGPYGYDIPYTDLAAFHGDVVADVTLGSYSGDMLFILRDRATGLYGYVSTGYGSCSGCDELQHIMSGLDYGDVESVEKAWAELAAFVDEMRPTVWRAAPEMLAWLNDHDWQGDWQGGDESAVRTWITNEVAPKFAA